jgi:hypothetical protein
VASLKKKNEMKMLGDEILLQEKESGGDLIWMMKSDLDYEIVPYKTLLDRHIEQRQEGGEEKPLRVFE